MGRVVTARDVQPHGIGGGDRLGIDRIAVAGNAEKDGLAGPLAEVAHKLVEARIRQAGVEPSAQHGDTVGRHHLALLHFGKVALLDHGAHQHGGAGLRIVQRLGKVGHAGGALDGGKVLEHFQHPQGGLHGAWAPLGLRGRGM